ncbi:MAG: hypothetical protein ACTSYD_05120, partial [Candidatus Heimdallarchaeaceae archaeon]
MLILFLVSTIIVRPLEVIPMIPIRIIFLLLGVFLLIRRKVAFTKEVYYCFIISLLLVVSMLFQVLLGYLPLEKVYPRIFGHILIFPFIVYISIRLTRKQIKHIANLLAIIIVILCFISIFQAFSISWAIRIPVILGNIEQQDDFNQINMASSLIRVSGFYSFSIPLTYLISFLSPWIFFYKKNIRFLLYICLFTISLLSGTRSIIIGIAIIFPFLFFDQKNKLKRFKITLFSFLLLCVISVVILSCVFPAYRAYISYSFGNIGKEISSLSRFDLWGVA